MTQRNYVEMLEKELNENKFHILSQEWGNGYFVFDMGDDSVCHFIVKEIPHWKFGIWFTFDEDKKNIVDVEVFTRHMDDLDKFKPTRSFFSKSEEVKPDADTNEYLSTIYYIVNIIKLIKHYPILTYVASYQMSWGCTDHILKSYISLRVSNKKYQLKKWYENKFKYNMTYLKLLMIKRKILKFSNGTIKEVKIYDNNGVFPRYNMYIISNSDEFNDRILGYVYYKPSGKARWMDNATIEFSDGSRRGYDYEVYREDYFLAYKWKANIFGRKKYIDKIKMYNPDNFI